MGSCLSAAATDGTNPSVSSDTAGDSRGGSTSHGGSRRHRTSGKTRPLKAEKPRWKSDIPLTQGQLRSKRDEFWDTAPAFEGRKEIWDALRAAALALEQNDHALAQAIIDGASISLPHGTLTECYDELGSRYQLPVYCLSSPTNLVRENADPEDDDDNDDDDGGGGNDKNDEGGDGDGKAKKSAGEKKPPEDSGVDLPLKLRLSSGEDVKVNVRSKDTVLSVKKLLCSKHPEIKVEYQRWYFAGKMLNDAMRLEEAKLKRGYVVQVIVNFPSGPGTPISSSAGGANADHPLAAS